MTAAGVHFGGHQVCACRVTFGRAKGAQCLGDRDGRVRRLTVIDDSQLGAADGEAAAVSPKHPVLPSIVSS
jgi:hypothetical protein